MTRASWQRVSNWIESNNFSMSNRTKTTVLSSTVACSMRTALAAVAVSGDLPASALSRVLPMWTSQVRTRGLTIASSKR